MSLSAFSLSVTHRVYRYCVTAVTCIRVETEHKNANTRKGVGGKTWAGEGRSRQKADECVHVVQYAPWHESWGAARESW